MSLRGKNRPTKNRPSRRPAKRPPIGLPYVCLLCPDGIAEPPVLEYVAGQSIVAAQQLHLANHGANLVKVCRQVAGVEDAEYVYVQPEGTRDEAA